MGMTENAAYPCRGEPCGCCDRADGVALSERSGDRGVPHASRLVELFGENGEVGGVLGDLVDWIDDHNLRIIKLDLN